MHWQLLIAISLAIISELIAPAPLLLRAACSFAAEEVWSPLKPLILFWFSLSTLFRMDSIMIVFDG